MAPAVRENQKPVKSKQCPQEPRLADPPRARAEINSVEPRQLAHRGKRQQRRGSTAAKARQLWFDFRHPAEELVQADRQAVLTELSGTAASQAELWGFLKLYRCKSRFSR